MSDTKQKFLEFKKRLTLRNILLLLVGMLLINFGIALSIQANLGTATVSSTPYVLSKFTPFTIGNWTIVIQVVAILLQILVLKKDYNPINLCQLILAFIFGYFTDFCIWVVGTINCTSYLMQWAVDLAGMVLIGIGVAFEVEANVMMVSIEGLAYALATKYKKPFGNMKSLVDVCCVVLACILSLIGLGKIVGVREGTLVAAILVGQIAKVVKKILFTKK